MRDADPTPDAPLVRESSPLNVEMPFWQLDSFRTPNESFYIRSHFPIPEIARDEWRLEITGEIEQPFALTYDELRELEPREIGTTLECAGNNRRLLAEKVKGVQWGLGAVGNAMWRGVPLGAVLGRAKPKSNAVEVILEGADEGEIEGLWAPPGMSRFARSIPLEKALDDVLLASEMNGVQLPVEHGFPVRAIVPGWYAVASVKWLRRIIVTGLPYAGYYQTLDYAYWKTEGALRHRVPLAEMQPKAQIARPRNGERLREGATVRIAGAAWGGSGFIERVELSFDGGSSWSATRLVGEAQPNAWRLWEYEWRVPATAGKLSIVARATDSHGRSQPVQHDPDRGTYMINQLLPIEVEVVGAS